MELVRHESNPIATLFDELENIWSGPFDLTCGRVVGRPYPNVDIVENDKGYTIEADLPGLAKENIKLSVEDGVLTISGEKKREFERKEKTNYSHFERSYGSFSRSFSLPANVNGTDIDARYADGVLRITLNKTEEAKPKAIEVKIG